MRRLEFEGCFNFRDLGGWRTADGGTIRWGRLFRADAVHLGALGVRDDYVVDDYVLTAESIDRIIGRFASTVGAPARCRYPNAGNRSLR